jgi:uncharacterized protein
MPDLVRGQELSADRRIGQIVLKIATRCNLNCSYCYIYNHEDTGFYYRPNVIKESIYESTLSRIKEYCDLYAVSNFHLCFHGGEPTLVGLRRFKELVTRAQQVLSRRLGGIYLQTNGTLIDQAWAKTLKELCVGVSVSLDGPADIHDATRVDHRGGGSYAATVRGIKALQDTGINPTVLCVVHPGADGENIYKHFRSLNITSMDFLLPDVSHDNKDRMYSSLGDTPVAEYLIPALDAWLAEDDPKVAVRLFQDLFRRLMGGGGLIDAFGGSGSSYLIVETDGTIQANDALRVCEDGIARTGLNVLHHGFDNLELGLPLAHKAITGGFSLPTICRGCSEREICGGGYLPHRYSRKNGFDNPSVWCSDILKILAKMRAYLQADGLPMLAPVAGGSAVNIRIKTQDSKDGQKADVQVQA